MESVVRRVAALLGGRMAEVLARHLSVFISFSTGFAAEVVGGLYKPSSLLRLLT